MPDPSDPPPPRAPPEAAPAPLTAAALDGPLAAVDPGARYAPGALLGEGGMGQVWEAADAVLGRRVALKVMHPSMVAAPDGLRRFLREARVQGQLEHPAVVPVYDLGYDAQGLPFFTMKQVRGLTLEYVLGGLAAGDPELRARFPRRRLLTAFVQVCRCLDFAHRRGVLHRDLKPGNIMLGEFGDVHVLDWGLAQAAGEREAGSALAEPPARPRGSVFGTPGYVAPEQIRGRPLDERADVYALGATLFEVLTLVPMLEGSFAEQVARALHDGAPSPAQAAPYAEVPPELDQVVVEATRTDPAQRTPSARLLAEAVERYLDGDRDLELRRRLAAGHLARARPLVDRLDEASAAERELAMAELSQALALEPGREPGLQLLRQLLAHVPAQLPPEAQAAQDGAEAQARAGVARTVAQRMAMWFLLAPLVWAMGPVSAPLAAAVVGAVAASMALAFWASRRAQVSSPLLAAVLASTGLPLLGAGLIFGAFVLVPCLASTGVVIAASHLRPPGRRALIALSLLVVLAPFGLEELGLLAPAYAFVENELRVLPRLVSFPPGSTKLLLVVATGASLALPGYLAGQLRDRLVLAERRLFMMAWHLERLGKTGAALVPGRVPAWPPPARPAPAPPTPTLEDASE